MNPNASPTDCVRRGRASRRPQRGLALRTACAAVALAVAGAAAGAEDAARFTLERAGVDAATEERVLALAPEHISAREVREILARVDAPRIINLQGSVPILTMAPFAEFLIAMGYPEARI